MGGYLVGLPICACTTGSRDGAAQRVKEKHRPSVIGVINTSRLG